MVGIGLSTPYLTLILNPSFSKYLPRPGMWMLKVKKLMGFLFLSTIFWLIYVLMSHGNSVSIMILSLLVTFYVASFKLIHSKSEALNHLYQIVGVLILGLGVLLQEHNELFTLNNKSSNSFVDEQQIQQKIQKENKIVLLDITADWCLTCKDNEKLVIYTSRVQKLFQENNVELVVVDWTRRNAKIYNYLVKHGRYGIPFNQVFSKKHPEGILLPELLDANLLEDAIRDAK